MGFYCISGMQLLSVLLGWLHFSHSGWSTALSPPNPLRHSRGAERVLICAQNKSPVISSGMSLTHSRPQGPLTKAPPRVTNILKHACAPLLIIIFWSLILLRHILIIYTWLLISAHTHTHVKDSSVHTSQMVACERYNLCQMDKWIHSDRDVMLQPLCHPIVPNRGSRHILISYMCFSLYQRRRPPSPRAQKPRCLRCSPLTVTLSFL